MIVLLEQARKNRYLKPKSTKEVNIKTGKKEDKILILVNKGYSFQKILWSKAPKHNP